MKSIRTFSAFLIIIALNSFFCLAEDESTFNATITDMSDISTEVYDLGLHPAGSGYIHHKYILIRTGESEQSIPFGNIVKVEFNGTPEKPFVIINLANGENITGEVLKPYDYSIPISRWVFEGVTKYGKYVLSIGKTKRIIFHTTPVDDTQMFSRAKELDYIASFSG